MFLGTHTPKLDDKGRLTLPAKFRDALAGGLMITKGQDHCLYVFPRAEFATFGRRADGGWELLQVVFGRIWTDSRPLVVPDQAELREYRVIGYARDGNVGDFSSIATVWAAP